MVRAVLDPNVIIAALLSPTGSPARVLRAWIDGGYELVLSPLLLGELERALRYPKLAERITETESQELVGLLRHGANLCEDPSNPAVVRSSDPDDDYLITLGATAQSVIVSGDHHLNALQDKIPVYSPRAFLTVLEESGSA